MKITKWTGKPIKKPGWYSDIPLDTYHSAGICDGRAVSSSNLRTCWSKSPAHMFAQWCENPNAEPRKPTASMLLGAVTHFLLLGEDDFRGKYVEQPSTYRDKVTAVEKPWNNNAAFCREWNGYHESCGRIVVKREQLDTVIAMARSVSLQPLVVEGLLKGAVECSGFVKDMETGLWIKVRPDVIPTAAGDFVDLKTTTDVTSYALMSTIRNFGYHQQGALIQEAVEQLGAGHAFEEFFLMFVETAAPYCARAFPLSREDLMRGRKQNRAMLRLIADCIDTGHWPGPGEDDLQPLPLSVDERARIDARLKREGIPT
jgi:hypothetical protein